MTVLTASVDGAPPVFVLTNGVHLGTQQGIEGLLVTLDEQHVFVVASGSSLEIQGQGGAEEQIKNESYEKSDD
jgi:hypothetical protein